MVWVFFLLRFVMCLYFCTFVKWEYFSVQRMMWEPLELELQELVTHWTWLLETPKQSLQPPTIMF